MFMLINKPTQCVLVIPQEQIHCFPFCPLKATFYRRFYCDSCWNILPWHPLEEKFIEVMQNVSSQQKGRRCGHLMGSETGSHQRLMQSARARVAASRSINSGARRLAGGATDWRSSRALLTKTNQPPCGSIGEGETTIPGSTWQARWEIESAVLETGGCVRLSGVYSRPPSVAGSCLSYLLPAFWSGLLTKGLNYFIYKQTLD